MIVMPSVPDMTMILIPSEHDMRVIASVPDMIMIQCT